ncbi:hypothetical protein RRF57_013425 [Xylaria bambusicola]|uniref:Uncharacterized protein n=1 Tax=Xylaria bambusicola TaxID=326684 RepID=A0AAN7URS5_9PEZI
MYRNTRISEDVIKPRPDARNRGFRPFTSAETGSTRALDTRNGEHHHKTESSYTPYLRESAVPEENGRSRNWHESSKVGTDRYMGTSTSSTQSTTLDFEKVKLSPRKYMHPKGGDSGLAKISTMRDHAVAQPPDLMLQSDCARDLKRAIHQRYGKDPRHQVDRKFDYSRVGTSKKISQNGNGVLCKVIGG